MALEDLAREAAASIKDSARAGVVDYLSTKAHPVLLDLARTAKKSITWGGVAVVIFYGVQIARAATVRPDRP